MNNEVFRLTGAATEVSIRELKVSRDWLAAALMLKVAKILEKCEAGKISEQRMKQMLSDLDDAYREVDADMASAKNRLVEMKRSGKIDPLEAFDITTRALTSFHKEIGLA